MQDLSLEPNASLLLCASLCLQVPEAEIDDIKKAFSCRDKDMIRHGRNGRMTTYDIYATLSWLSCRLSNLTLDGWVLSDRSEGDSDPLWSQGCKLTAKAVLIMCKCTMRYCAHNHSSLDVSFNTCSTIVQLLSYSNAWSTRVPSAPSLVR